MRMKNILVFLVSIVLFFGLFLLYDMFAFKVGMYSAGLTENSKKEDVGQTVEVQIIDMNDNILLVRPTSEIVELGKFEYGYWEYIFDSSDVLEIDLNGVEVNCELFEDKIVNIVYHYLIGTSGDNPIHLNKVSEISDIHQGYWEDVILFNGRRYNKSWLGSETLDWIAMSEEERANSSYYPEKLEKVGRFELTCNIDAWGISLKADNVTSNGLTLVCEQKDFIPTTTNDTWEIRFNSPYVIQKFEYGVWKDLKVKSKDVAWGSEVWIIENNGVSRMDIDWGSLYGELSSGEYRIKKEIGLQKEFPNITWKTIYARFEIE